MLHAPRDTWVEANREGLANVLAMLALEGLFAASTSASRTAATAVATSASTSGPAYALARCAAGLGVAVLLLQTACAAADGGAALCNPSRRMVSPRGASEREERASERERERERCKRGFDGSHAYAAM
jgi:hypothetical protein